MTNVIRPGWQNKPNSYGAKAYLAKRIKDSLKVVLDADPMKRTRGQIIIDNLMNVASGAYGPETSIAAFNAIAKAAGLYDGESDKPVTVVVRTELVFENREGDVEPRVEVCQPDVKGLEAQRGDDGGTTDLVV